MPTYPEKLAARNLDLTIRSEADAVTIICVGRLNSENAQLLKMQVKAMIPQEKHIILDFTQLVGMDSSGLGSLVGLYLSAKNAKCQLQLVNLSKPVRDLLGLTNLLSVFGTCAEHGVRFP